MFFIKLATVFFAWKFCRLLGLCGFGTFVIFFCWSGFCSLFRSLWRLYYWSRFRYRGIFFSCWRFWCSSCITCFMRFYGRCSVWLRIVLSYFVFSWFCRVFLELSVGICYLLIFFGIRGFWVCCWFSCGSGLRFWGS